MYFYGLIIAYQSWWYNTTVMVTIFQNFDGQEMLGAITLLAIC